MLTQETEKTTAFPIVGIGASAGGLESYEQFFEHVPDECGMAFVLVLHLDPTHASLLTEILQRKSVLPVVEAEDQMRVQVNYVYVIPPNHDMTIFQGVLQLNEPSAPRGQRLAIDIFFQSLANDQAENAIGIVLSGTGSDGTLGLREILNAGGVTLVQEPSTAKYEGMPSSAVSAGVASHILTIDKMWDALHLLSHQAVTSTQKTLLANHINPILMQLRQVTGHDFSQYKKSTIGRRIERQMTQHAIDDTAVYARYLQDNPDEVRNLFRELLINVTGFFRDAGAFDTLEHEILPQLCANNDNKDTVFRVWVAGCSTGEEAYSIAILLRERMIASHDAFKVQIYSTDLDDEVIAFARAGLYPFSIAPDITPARLQRFFIKEELGYRVKKEIREMVVFAVQNLIKDPLFTKLDLLSCRNVLIYLTAELQNRLIPTFHYALKPEGVLFLSPSEGIGNHIELFSAMNRRWKFYRAKPSALSTRVMMSHSLAWVEPAHKPPVNLSSDTPTLGFADWVRQLLVQFFAPASVITDTKGDVLYVHGETGCYLRPALGHASLNIIEMAREGLGLELYAAIQTAAKGEATLNRQLQIKTNGGFSAVKLSVRAVSHSNEGSKLLLISFEEVAEPLKAKRHKAAPPAELARINELERELAYLKESYQATIEEQQTSNEELKSTNEELQSTNEELETAKEELQSINEELITVNTELQSKIEQLADVQNDMKNLLDNINMGIIFLDTHLVIRRFTRDAQQVYRLVASDVGRPLMDIKSPFAGDELLCAAQTVLDSLIPYERELHIGGDNWLLVRIQPYRTLDNVIDGVVLTFNDISQRVQSRSEQTDLTQKSEIRLALILADTDLAAWDWDIVTGQVIFNERWAALRGMSLAEIAPQIQSWQNSIVPADFLDVEKLLAAHLDGQTPFFKAEYRVKTPSGAAIWVMNRGTVIARNAQGTALRMSNIEINITKRIQMETTA